MSSRRADSKLGLDASEFEFTRSAPLPSPRIDAAIRTEIGRDLEPVRRFGRAPRIVLSMGAFLVVALAFAAMKYGDGFHQLTESALLGVAGWALVVLGVLIAGFGRFRSTTRWIQIGIASSVPSLFLVYLLLGRTNWLPLGHFLGSSADMSSAFRCAMSAIGLGVVTSASVLFVWRKTDPFNPGWSGALAGLIGGLAGAMSVGLVCPGREGWHLWLGHGLCVVALALVGASLGRRVLSP